VVFPLGIVDVGEEGEGTCRSSGFSSWMRASAYRRAKFPDSFRGEVQFLKSHEVAILREMLRNFAKMNLVAGSDFACFQREDSSRLFRTFPSRDALKATLADLQ
jgi:hypothetical protein